MKTDYHLHTSFSADSDVSMVSMIEQGLKLGLETMCFTEHLDYDFFSEGLDFEVDTQAYLAELLRCRGLYGNRIELLFGIEMGLQPHLTNKLKDYVNEWDFDFIIGSSHAVAGVDPYYSTFYEGRKEEECYHQYFESVAENLRKFSDIDVYGHIDYVVRYGPNKNKFYSYEKYKDVLDPILRLLIERGVGLELNTAGYKYGLGLPHPHPDILKRYRQMGGEIITVGSDAHAPQHLAYEFDKAEDLLKTCGFRYYTVFRKRKPEFIKI